MINQDKANSVQEFKDGVIDIESNIILIKGKVRENFDSPDKVNWKSQKDEEMRENKYDDNKDDPFFDAQKEYGLGSYGAAHANYESEDGGGVNNQLPKNKPINKKTIKFHIDLDKETIKVGGEIVDHKKKDGGSSNKEKKSGKPLNRI
ncbi:MAG: hypothetical protein J6P03_03955 [Opitutales bacterium]|nr:hypothetical protein [Opitutales bacterium]